MKTLSVGISGSLSTQVGSGNTITLGDDQRATVFSTPSMINLMEHAARQALQPHLDPGEESVGVDVQITHSAATPPRNEVTAVATVTAIDKNVVSFEVVAKDRWGEIGRGTHRRAVIETTKFARRLEQQKPTDTKSSSLPHVDSLDCQHSAGVLRVVLNRPRKRNAMTGEMTSAWEQIVDWLQVNQDTVRTVLVSGAANTFCAGDDVADLPNDVKAAKRLSVRRGELYQHITRLPQVFIAAIDGLALGGGLVLAAACDFRIATHRAQLSLPESSLGWPPNYGMGIVQSLIGRGRTLELALSGQMIDARQAASIGLVNQVVAARELMAAAEKMAGETAGKPASAIAATKQLLEPGTEWCDLKASELFGDCLATAEARQSISRFRG